MIASTGDVAHCLNAGGMGWIDYETETLVAHAMRGEGFDASEDGNGRGIPLVPVSFDCKGSQVQFETDGTSPTLRSMNHNAGHQNGGGQLAVALHERAVCQDAARRYALRRLTPLECIRLQGFPDDYFTSARLNKPFADGPIYKMLGNSMAVNVMRWIGDRIDAVRAIREVA